MLFQEPVLDADDQRVLAEIAAMRERLRWVLAEPRRWQGVLRRNLQARAVRGSNSIEGYHVTLSDAAAAVAQQDPTEADAATWAEITGYQRAMTYVQQLARDPHFSYSEGLLRSLHFMMLGHHLEAGPGLYRPGEIYVSEAETQRTVYTGPDAGLVPDLVAELMATLNAGTQTARLVRAAMAHLNLVMIHPFRDGNGRMARCLQTLVLAREGILSPELSSIEEFLGRHTPDYYAVLAEVGAGSWHPERDAGPWVRFALRAHHLQAQAVQRRTLEASALFVRLDALAADHGLSVRVSSALYDAALGLRVRRSTYAADAGLKDGVASLDLRGLVAAGLLLAHGQTKGRTYVASERLLALRREVQSELPDGPTDPYAEVDALNGQEALFPD